jgi:hypothetical protein
MELGKSFPKDHGDGVELLAGRAGGGPDGEFFQGGPLLDEPGNDILLERLKRMKVPEERSMPWVLPS